MQIKVRITTTDNDKISCSHVQIFDSEDEFEKAQFEAISAFEQFFGLRHALIAYEGDEGNLKMFCNDCNNTEEWEVIHS